MPLALRCCPRVARTLAFLVAMCLCALPLAAQNLIVGGGDPTPPNIYFEPLAGTYYAAQQQFVAHVCDAEAISNTSIVVKVNNATVGRTITEGDPSCFQHRVVTFSTTLNPGANTLSVRACETLQNQATCDEQQATVNLATGDAVRPTGLVSPGSNDPTVRNLTARFTWCDDYKLDLASPEVWLNGTPVPSSTQPAASTDQCYSGANTDATLALQPGPNLVQAVVRDSAGNVSDTVRITYTYRPRVAVVGEGRVLQPGLCAVGCFDANLGYSSPAYISLDAERSFGLVYSSGKAAASFLIQAEVPVDVGAVPARIGIAPRSTQGVPYPQLGTGQTEAVYEAVAGGNRVSTWVGNGAALSGTYTGDVAVRRYFSNTTLEDIIPTRTVVVTDAASPFGAGWSVAGYQRIVVPTGNMDTTGVTLVSGDGSGAFFEKPAACAAGDPCTYVSPPGDYSTLARTADGYVRVSIAGDSTVFSSTGRLVRVADLFGNTTSFTDQTSGCSATYGCQLAAITDPAGKVTTLTYTAAGLLDYVTLPTGGVVDVTIDPVTKDLVRVTDPDGVAALSGLTYTGHRLTSYVNRAGSRTDIAYDRWGKVAQIVGPAFRAQGSAAYRDTTFFRSEAMALLPAQGYGTSSAPAPAVRSDTVSVTVTDQRRRTSKIRLDKWHAASWVQDALGFVSTVSRDAVGNVTSSTTPTGQTTRVYRDGPRVTLVVTPEGSTNYEYGGPGQRLSRVYGTDGETLYFYADTAHHFVVDSMRVEGEGVTRFTYDARGRVLTQSDSSGDQTAFAYEPGGFQNTLYTILPGHRVTEVLARDAWGRPTQVRNPDQRVISSVFDLFGRVTSTTLPDGGLMRYHYGVAQLDSLTDPEGNRYRWTRNQLGWVESEVRPGPATIQREFDRYGRVVKSTDRNGTPFEMQYDSLDRVVRRTALVEVIDPVGGGGTLGGGELGGGETGGSAPGVQPYVQYTYSPIVPGDPNAPRWVAIENTTSLDTLFYDSKGRQWRSVTVRGGRQLVIEHTYTEEGLQDTTRYSLNQLPWRVMRYITSPTTGQLQRLVDYAGNTTKFRYDGEGRLTRDSLPNGQVGTYTYSSNDELTLRTFSGSALNNAAGLGYSYTPTGQVQHRTSADQLRLRDFSYDENQRLKGYSDWQSVVPNRRNCTLEENVGLVCPDDGEWTVTPRRTFTWDRNGNPTDSGAVVLANRLTHYRGWDYSYDGEGRMAGRERLVISPTSGSYSYGWTAFGELSGMSNNQIEGAPIVQYQYDGLGRRVSRWTPGDGEEFYFYDGDDLLLDVAGNGTVTREYTYYPGTDHPHSVLMGGQRYYYSTDLQGSVLAITNSSGAVVNQYRYTPFGETELAAEGIANRLKFAGRELDLATGLYYVRARWYDPQTQRFISEDPIGLEGGINPYTYAENDPIGMSDPSGLIPTPCDWQLYICLDGVSNIWEDKWAWSRIAQDRLNEWIAQNDRDRGDLGINLGKLFGDAARMATETTVKRTFGGELWESAKQWRDPSAQCSTRWALNKAVNGVIPSTLFAGVANGLTRGSLTRAASASIGKLPEIVTRQAASAGSGSLMIGRGAFLVDGLVDTATGVGVGLLGGLAYGLVVADANLLATCRF